MSERDQIEKYKRKIRQMTESNSDPEYLKGVYTFAKHYQPRNSKKAENRR